ncbi:unnamed protein product [Phytophthora lilii]|uniref:Unnamed protein product n=1 Tax=Phytophthora lilii TaxID=2077276 RepID=A0A9W6TFC6_9STRA|nr:unnamed protein product [Phytophthora lilii]
MRVREGYRSTPPFPNSNVKPCGIYPLYKSICTGVAVVIGGYCGPLLASAASQQEEPGAGLEEEFTDAGSGIPVNAEVGLPDISVDFRQSNTLGRTDAATASDGCAAGRCERPTWTVKVVFGHES